MKMIAGAASFACLKRSRTRLAPTPTIASPNSDALIEKNGACASPAPARASSVLPVPGGPLSSRPRGMRPPSRLYLSGLRRKSTISVSSSLASSMPATSSNVTCCSLGFTRRAPHFPKPLDAPAARLAEAEQPAAGALARGAAGEPHEESHQQQRRAEADQQVGEQAAALLGRLGVHLDVALLER